MRRSAFSLILIGLILSFSQLQALMVLDEVMSKDEQNKTGVDKLSRTQKMELETWLNQNFVLKKEDKAPQPQLYLSINIDNGQKLELSDNSLWEIAPDDVQTSAVWITPFPVKITQSGDSDYPCLIVNQNSGISVKARPISSSTQPSSQTS